MKRQQTKSEIPVPTRASDVNAANFLQCLHYERRERGIKSAEKLLEEIVGMLSLVPPQKMNFTELKSWTYYALNGQLSQMDQVASGDLTKEQMEMMRLAERALHPEQTENLNMKKANTETKSRRKEWHVGDKTKAGCEIIKVTENPNGEHGHKVILTVKCLATGKPFDVFSQDAFQSKYHPDVRSRMRNAEKKTGEPQKLEKLTEKKSSVQKNKKEKVTKTSSPKKGTRRNK